MTVPPEFEKIFSSPVEIISDYSLAPEYRGTRRFPDHSPPPENYDVQVLGKHPEIFHYKATYTHVPVPLVHTLSRPLWYDGFVFSNTGGMFVDNARMYMEEPLRLNFGLGAERNPIPLAADSFLMPSPRWESPEIKHYDGQFMPFLTYTEYGHYLLESVPLLWVLEYGIRPTLILHHGLARVPGRILGLVEPFGLDERAFIIPEPFARFETVFMPRRSYMHAHYFGVSAQKTLRRIGEYYASGHDQWPKRIYLTRRAFSRRRLLNEEACEDLFRRYGFTVIAPEEMTVAQQAALFARATHVAGPIGSAMHNVVLSLAPSTLKVLFLGVSPYLSQSYFMTEKAYSRQANVILGETVTLNHIGIQPATWTMPLDNLEIGLRQWLDS